MILTLMSLKLLELENWRERQFCANSKFAQLSTVAVPSEFSKKYVTGYKVPLKKNIAVEVGDVFVGVEDLYSQYTNFLYKIRNK